MTTLTRTLAALAVLAALSLPHLVAPPRTAQADLCTACADPDVPEVLLHLPSGVYAATEGSSHHEQTSAGA